MHNPSNITNNVIIVIGMHRSGTSAITRGLLALGVNLGNNLMPAASGNNEAGFWEDLDVNALNIDIMNAIDSDWHSVSPIPEKAFTNANMSLFKERAHELLKAKTLNYDVWGVKDPRMTVLLPFWKSIFRELDISVSYVISLRHPMSVANSLKARDGFSEIKSYLLWLKYVVASINESKGSMRVVVDYDKLLDNPEEQLLRIANVLALDPNSRKQQIDEYKNHFLADRLRHHRYDNASLTNDRSVPKLVIETYKIMHDLAVDRLSIESSRAYSFFEHIGATLSDISVELSYIDSSSGMSLQLAVESGDQLQQVTDLSRAILARDATIARLQEKLANYQSQLSNASGGHNKPLSTGTALEPTLAHHSDANPMQGGCSQTTFVHNNKDCCSVASLDKDRKIADLIMTLAEQCATLNSIYSSYSWYLTKPLRFAGRLLRGERQLVLDAFVKKATIPAIDEAHMIQPYKKATFPNMSASFAHQIGQPHCSSTVRIAVVLHIYYPDLLEEFITYLNNIPFAYKLYVSTDESCLEQVKSRLQRAFRADNVSVVAVPNRGKGIGSFIVGFKDIYKDYDLVCYLHSKKTSSVYGNDLENWRAYLLDNLVGSNTIVHNIVTMFLDDPALGLITPVIFPPVRPLVEWGSNQYYVSFLANRLGIDVDFNMPPKFPAGSMFWFRPEALSPLFKLGIGFDDFEDSSLNTIDGTLAHAFERIFFYVVEKTGFKWTKTLFRPYSKDGMPYADF